MKEILNRGFKDGDILIVEPEIPAVTIKDKDGDIVCWPGRIVQKQIDCLTDFQTAKQVLHAIVSLFDCNVETMKETSDLYIFSVKKLVFPALAKKPKGL